MSYNAKELFDPACDPDNPRKIKFEEVMNATHNTLDRVVHTPCIKSKLSEKLGMDLYLKLENLQFGGSFKFRGVTNVLLNLTEDQKRHGVVTSSTGNHAIATALACFKQDIQCIIFVPTCTPQMKIIKCQSFGAKVVVVGPNIIESMKVALAVCKDKKMTYINGYDHPKMLEGNGSLGVEILEQVPNADAVLASVGGGGLIAGVGVAIKGLKPDTEVYGIESDKTCSMTESLKRNERFYFPIDDTMVDNIKVNLVGVNAFQACKAVIDKMIVVTEDWVPKAIAKLVEEDRIIVESGGAITVAACLAGHLPNLKGKKVVCVMSGGNLAGQYLARSLELGLSSEGRLVKFKVTISDKMGSVSELYGLLANIGVNIKDCVPERAWVQGDVFSMEMTVLAETKNWAHVKELVDIIKRHYKQYQFQEFPDENSKIDPCTRRGPCLAPTPICMQRN